MAASEDEHDETKLLHMTFRLNKCYIWIIRYELFWQPVEMDKSSHFSTARQKLNETKLNERFHFCIPLKRATFLSRAVQSHPMNPLNYGTDIMLNYYSPVTSSQHSSCKVYTKGGLTNSLCNDRRWSKCKSTDMIMHKRINCLFAWKNLFANQKSGLSGLFCD